EPAAEVAETGEEPVHVYRFGGRGCTVRPPRAHYKIREGGTTSARLPGPSRHLGGSRVAAPVESPNRRQARSMTYQEGRDRSVSRKEDQNANLLYQSRL